MTGRRVGVVVLVVLATAGCGVPRDSGPRPVPAAQVDPRLRATATPSPSESAEVVPSSTLDVAFVTAEDELALVARSVPAGPPARQAQELLGALSTGPDDAEHSRGLSTALPSGTTLRLDALESGVAVVALETAADADPRRLPLSVAQVVLTLTSHPGITAVRITRAGEPVEAPLPDGALVRRPLTRLDYSSLVAPSPSPTPTT